MNQRPYFQLVTVSLIIQRFGDAIGARSIIPRLCACGLKQGGQESNLQPPVLETGALPIELPPLVCRILSMYGRYVLKNHLSAGQTSFASHLGLGGVSKKVATFAQSSFRTPVYRFCWSFRMVRDCATVAYAGGFRRDYGLVDGLCASYFQVNS